MRTLTVALSLVLAAYGSPASTPMNALVGTLEKTLKETTDGLQKRREDWADWSARTQNQINDQKGDIAQYQKDAQVATAKRDGGNAKAEAKANEIAQCDKEIAAAQAEMDEATTQRNKEKDEYTKTLNDVNESISAIERASSVLKAKMGKTAQAALLDVAQLPTINSEDRQQIMSFIQQQPAQENVHGYQSSAVDVVFGMLEKLLDDFRNQRRTLDKTEADAKFEYKFLMQNNDGFIKNKNADKDRKTAERGEAMETAGEGSEELAQAEDLLKSTQGELAETQKSFNQREASTKEENDKDVGEIGALKQGIADLSPQFVQLASRVNRDTPLRTQAVSILEDDAKKIGSQRLNLLAQAIAANPFAKISKMVRDMIVKLREEAEAEAKHHGFCQGELDTNKQTRESKSADLDKLISKIEDCNAKVGKTSAHTASLQKKTTDSKKTGAKDQEDTNKLVATLAERRAEAKATADMIDNATGSLQEYFEKSGDPDSGKTITALLNEIKVDMEAKMNECDVNTQNAKDEFAARAQQRKINEAVMGKTVQGNDEKIGRITDNMKNYESDKAETSDALDAANQYYEKLKPQCVTQPVSYEERVQMREAEIQSLKEALTILQGSAGAAAGAAGNV